MRVPTRVKRRLIADWLGSLRRSGVGIQLRRSHAREVGRSCTTAPKKIITISQFLVKLLGPKLVQRYHDVI